MQRSLYVLALAVLGCCAGVAAEEPPRSERVERGRDLLAQYQCGACHTIPGVRAARGLVAPPLAAWSKRSYVAGRLPNRPELVARWIAAPQALVPGTSMPSMGVSPAEAEAMAAYLFTLK
jgi:cytochrome c